VSATLHRDWGREGTEVWRRTPTRTIGPVGSPCSRSNASLGVSVSGAILLCEDLALHTKEE
jgi:hypothetical protein